MLQDEDLIRILNDFASVWPKVFFGEDMIIIVLKNSKEF